MTRILVIEDNLILQGVYLRMLTDYDVVGFTSGEEALQHLRAHGTDFILSDQDLDGPIRGTDIYRHIREHHPQLTGKFLFVTGSAMEVHEIVGRNVPVLSKPIDCMSLATRIYELLNT